MLNELSQVVDAMDRQGIKRLERHVRITPMGKNKYLLVVSVTENGTPDRVEVWPGQEAQHLFRVEHGAAGSSFPGFNLPTPLRRLDGKPANTIRPRIESLLALAKKKAPTTAEISDRLADLFRNSDPRPFTEAQKTSFERSCGELVTEFKKKLSPTRIGLENFCRLLDSFASTPPTLGMFAEKLAELLARGGSELSPKDLWLFQDVLFGALDWKKRRAEIGMPKYLKEKSKQDQKANQPLYLDVSNCDPDTKRVAHRATSEALNNTLVEIDRADSEGGTGRGTLGIDAYSGTEVELQDKFPSPKVAMLGALKLYSVNTNEVKALRRYKLDGSAAFPVAAKLSQKMNDALLYLAREEMVGWTCRAVPSAHPGKWDLLVAYLEGEPPAKVQLAEMFGGEVRAFSAADFAAISQPVLQLLEAKAAANPNLNVRLLSFCSVDKGRKQISLNRQVRASDLIRATSEWRAGVSNAPEVSIYFYEKFSGKEVARASVVPYPIDLASTVNRVWSADSKAGFASSFQRAFSNSDAYDVFLADTPDASRKAEAALTLLVCRMSVVLGSLGKVKAMARWSDLSELVRWQSLKTIALFGILLHRTGHKKDNFMRETITQIGRLLALADGLHLQYCKHVRKEECPSQLIGNALFATALEQPVFAMARLAERLSPYQAWARTFRSADPSAGVGLVKYFLAELATCTDSIKISDIPSRMQDADKAKLLLGYLADSQKSKPQAE